MTLKKNAHLLFAFSFVAAIGSFLIESESQAQHFRRQPGQELGRFLGLGHGNGYHCRTPGPQADYYNPYSTHNSYLVSRNLNPGRYSNMKTGYAVGGLTGAVPHSEYTATPSKGHSVFEGLPGQAVSPSFESVEKRKSQFQKDLEERDFEEELNLDEEENDGDGDGFRSRLEDLKNSAVNREEDENDGSFDSLQDSFEGLDSEGSSAKDSLQPNEGDQATFFGNGFDGN